MERERLATKEEKKGLFQKDGRGGPGRPKGSQTQIKVDLQKAIVEAASLVGCDGYGTHGTLGYLYALAIERPEIFGRLLERVLPVRVTGQVHHEVTNRTYETVEALQEAMKARGLPPPRLIDVTPARVK